MKELVIGGRAALQVRVEPARHKYLVLLGPKADTNLAHERLDLVVVVEDLKDVHRVSVEDR